MTKSLQDYTKEELIEQIKSLKKSKKFGLVWEDKPEQVAIDCETKLPVLTEVTERAIKKADDQPTNLIIEGDNYHSLSTLNYTHAGKIDVIYIDPPYNTGATDWRYNNDYVDRNDAFRHSKWIAMMEKRIRLAKNLLSESGFLICAIDENEVHNLRHILDIIFGEQNKVGMVTVLHNPKGRNLAKYFSENSEFMLVYAKDGLRSSFNSVAIDDDVKATFDLQDDQGKYRLQPYMRVRTVWSRENKPNNFYPIYVSKDLSEITLENKDGYYELYPKTDDGREWAWKNIASSFQQLNKDGYFVARKKGNKVELLHKYREQQVFKNVWTDKKYQSEFNGTNLLKAILGKNVFDYPKSLYLVEDILKITSKKNSIVLDFFAGSGTTGHAVLDLNKEDGGKRSFILCTNNENGIANEVTYPRIKGVVNGYKDVDGIPANLRYFKTDFVDRADTTDQTRVALVARATDMIKVRENTFETVLDEGLLKVYKGADTYSVIAFDTSVIDKAKTEIAKLSDDKAVRVYVFSLANDSYVSDFADLDRQVELCPIPESILEVYKRIFDQKGTK